MIPLKKQGFSEILGYLIMSITSVTIVQVRNISILDLNVREKWRSGYLRVGYFGQGSDRLLQSNNSSFEQFQLVPST